MNEQKNQTINLVNPLNPNEIIKTETIVPKVEEVVEEIIPSNEVTVEKKNNKKLYIIIIAVVLLLVIGGILIFVFTRNNTPNVPDDPIVDNEDDLKITTQNISDIFNQNIGNYESAENSTISSEVINNNIRVHVNVDSSIIDYEFIISDRDLTIAIVENDTTSYKLTLFIISAISHYHGLNFDEVYNHLNNIADLNDLNNVEVTDLEQIKLINIKLDEVLVMQ